MWAVSVDGESTPAFGDVSNENSVLLVLQTDDNFLGTVYFDDILLGTTVATYDGNRFAAGVAWKTTTGAIGVGSAVNLSSGSAYFSFFDATNVELVLKVIDGCALNNNFWVFAAGLTNVATWLVVFDHQGNSGIIFTTPEGPPFFPIEDTTALPTCSAAPAPSSFPASTFPPARTLKPGGRSRPLRLPGGEGRRQAGHPGPDGGAGAG